MSRVSRRPTFVALLVAGAFFMENLDGTVIATALPDMAKSFATTPEALAVGMTAYLLSLAIFIPASGWMADRFGARRVFSAAIALFTLASVGCALSNGATAFTLARILQGAAGALMTPVGRLIVLRGTAKADLMRAIATLTWPALVAPILGPPVGGFITHYTSWRWIFLINVPLGIAGLLLALRLIQSGAEPERRRFDYWGFLLNGLSLALLLYALDQFGRGDGDWYRPVSVLVVSAGLAGLAVRHALRHANPLVPLTAFQVPSFKVTMLGGSISRVVISTTPFLLPLLFQLGLGMDPLQSGLFVLWYGIANLGIKPLTSPILRRLGFRNVLLLNTVICAASLLACCAISSATPVWVTITLLLIAGASRSMQFTALNTLAFAELAPAMTAAGNTLFNMAFQLGIGLGIAFGAITLRVTETLTAGPDQTAIAPFHLAFIVIGVAGLLPLLDFIRLKPDAGTAVSGHSPRGVVPGTG